MKKVLKKLYIYLLGLIVPIKKNKVVFCNFLGKGYGDNPKYICEEMQRRNWQGELVWLLQNIDEKMPSYVRKVRIWSMKHYYELASANVIVTNVRVSLGLKKKRGQLYIQAWHGPYTPKLIEREAEEKLSMEYVEQAKMDGRLADAIIANDLLQVEQFKSFWLSGNVEILKYGMPRNDGLINRIHIPGIINEIKKELSITNDEYIILYAPTFRDDQSIEGYKLDIKGISRAFTLKYSRPVRVIVRLHPNVTFDWKTFISDVNCIDGNMVADVADLELISDCLITDYSSTMFDFTILSKPVFICALDYFDYKEMRGLDEEYDKLPYIISKSNEELIRMIERFDINEYDKRVKDYFSHQTLYSDGKSSEKIVSWIEDKLIKAESR